MYVSMKDILQHAHENNYAVMAMNSINMEMVKAGIKAAEEEYSPLIINLGQGQMANHASLNIMLPMIKNLAKNARVPIALNLDHGTKLEVEVDCINNGFSSVMFDGSSLSFEENVKRTKIIVALAHSKNICVEAELGHVGQANNQDDSKVDLYTDVNLAKEFVKQTNVDCLAVAIGTAHGLYPKGYVPKLDLNRLKELKNNLNMPLVLHGGSGLGEENIKLAIKYGINKINVCSDAFDIAKKTILTEVKNNPNIDYLNICIKVENSIKEFVKNYMRLIGSSNRYYYDDGLNLSKE